MIRWGILGVGNIAQRFIKSLSHSDEGVLYAVASYTLKKREAFSSEYPDVKIYDNYEDILNDPHIDVVYLAMRHNDHYQWAKKALKKHKAVLCEKPATLSYQQTQELCHLSKENNVLFLEGMKSRFIPLREDIHKFLKSQKLGQILEIQTYFCSDVSYMPESYLFDSLQGGALYDVGIYNIATLLDLIHSPVINIVSHVHYWHGVDAHDVIELTYESGQKAIIEISIQNAKEKSMIVKGEKGVLKAVPFYRPQKALIQFQDGTEEVLERSYIYDDFYTEIMEVHRCLKEHLIESPSMSHLDSLKCIALMERIKGTFHG